MANAGSALLWRGGHYNFGNADSSAAANASGAGDAALNQAQPAIKKLDGDVVVNEKNSLLNPKKQIKRRPPFDVSFLLKENGLNFIDRHFRNLKFKGKDHERRDLKMLIEQYREWAFLMYPAMNFGDVVKKTQSFSSKASVKGHLQKLRDSRDGVGRSAMDEDEDQDIDLAVKSNANPDAKGNPQSNEAQGSQPNTNPKGTVPADFKAVVQSRAQRERGQSGNAQQNAPNPQSNRNAMDFGGDPFEMMQMQSMDFGADPEEEDMAREMYG